MTEKNEVISTLIRKSIFFLIMIILAIFALVPFYAMFVMGTYDSFRMFEFNGLPSSYLMQNLKTVAASGMQVFFKNSIIVSFFSITFSLIFTSLCGYGLAKFKFRGRKFLYNLILFTMMVPSQLGIVAYVYEMRIFHMNNTLIPAIMPFLFSAFGAFWMKQYIEEAVPNEIIESARIDACGEIGIFFRIVLHFISPAFITLGLLVFVWSWNSFFIPLVSITDLRLFTVPLGVNSFNGLYFTDNGAKILSLSFATLPVLLAYIIFSNRLESGLAAGALKA